MMLLLLLCSLLCSFELVLAQPSPAQSPLQSSESFLQRSIFAKRSDIFDALAEPTYHSYDNYMTADTHAPYQGIASFAHLDITNCYSVANDGVLDIGIVGAPFDLGVTYRPGARFGPAGARMGARRLSPSFAYRYDGRCMSRQSSPSTNVCIVWIIWSIHSQTGLRWSTAVTLPTRRLISYSQFTSWKLGGHRWASAK